MSDDKPALAGLDTETHLIGADDIVPRLVCATFDVAPWGSTEAGDAWLVPNADPELVEQLSVAFKQVIEDRSRLIIHSASFDLTVIMRFAWEVQQGTQPGNRSEGEVLYGRIWEALELGMERELAGGDPSVHCTIIREKLNNLSTVGTIDTLYGRDVRYGLADIVKRRLGVDFTDKKVQAGQGGRIFDHEGRDITGTAQAGASWRLRYSELDGVPYAQWPEEAKAYAIEDATWARLVFVDQEQQRSRYFKGSMNSESLQVYADTALRLYTSNPFHVDKEQVDRVRARLEAIVGKHDLTLKLNGIVRPNNTVNTAVLKQRVQEAWQRIGQIPHQTDGGEVSCAAEVLDLLAGQDPILDQYAERQSFVKVLTAFLPNLDGGRIWSNYDILKETGRVSSYGSSDRSSKKPLFPAENVQQIPRADGVREAHLPPPGFLLVSNDYSALELCSIAQVTYTLFGYSIHRERINAGYDLHSFLGCALARILAPECVDHQHEIEAAYKALIKNRKLKIPDDDASPEAEALRVLKKAVGRWRDTAKPVGLGFPGGLGADTMVTFARVTYGVDMTAEQAKQFKDLWLSIYPEMKDAFRWVNQQEDPETGCTVYETQGFRRYRAGATYCATANGKFMQSLSADGAKRSVCWLARACYGGLPKVSPWALLTGCRPQAFIHDENLLAVPDDELATERAIMAARLMVRAMEVSMPDVRIAVEPAAMRRWTKKAEAEWQDDPAREERVEQAIRSFLGTEPTTAWVDEFMDIMGPDYRPSRRLVPWDDKHKLVL